MHNDCIGLIRRFEEFSSYLSPTAQIVANKTFENAIVKLQSALLKFRVGTVDLGPVISDNLSPIEEAQLAKRVRLANDIRYRSVVQIRPNSNMVERLFSQAKYVLTVKRKKMNPDHLNDS